MPEEAGETILTGIGEIVLMEKASAPSVIVA